MEGREGGTRGGGSGGEREKRKWGIQGKGGAGGIAPGCWGDRCPW